MYQWWVLIGIIAGFCVHIIQGQRQAQLGAATSVSIPAIVGGVIGAHIFHFIAAINNLVYEEVHTWHEGLIGGRTVLGGIIGGWLGVEVYKYFKGIKEKTGDSFAAPLAAALAFGRIGCWQAGCCGGQRCEAEFVFSTVSGSGEYRIAVSLIETGFHSIACLCLFLLFRKQICSGYLLYVYLFAYACVRFGLEFWRLHPDVVVGLTYYQLLSIGLGLAAALMIIKRARTHTELT